MLHCNTDAVWDCVVVGAGIEGSNAARYSATLGMKTLCLEQFLIPHDRGSSHGQSRITRYSHNEPFLAAMMPETFKMWNEIENTANTKLFINCGYLQMDDYPYKDIKEISAVLKANGISSELLTAGQLKEKYMLNYPDSVKGLLEKDGGILLASKCLKAVQEQFVQFGGVLHDNEKVIDIIPGDIVEVKTVKCSYKTKKVILTPGPWASSLLKLVNLSIPLRPKHISVCYWKVNSSGFQAINGYPTWYGEILGSSRKRRDFIYSTPCYEYPDLIKICYHDGPDVHPEERDLVDVTWTIDVTAKYVERHAIGVESKPSIVEHCMYTETPDRICVLDKHPGCNNIILGVGFSGSGFKLAPVYGKLLCELAFDMNPSYDMQPFKMDRFSKHVPKPSL